MSFKKFIFLILISTVLFSFKPEFISINTRVRICAVKGTVKTGNVKDRSFLSKDQCLLTQEMDETECRVVNQSTIIETGADGFAEIEYPNGTKLKMTPNTVVVLQQNEIYVKSGKTWFKVVKTPNNQLLIKTPTAITGIRGTEFLVNVEPDGTTNFQLIEGSVEISDSKEKSSMILNSGMEVTIQAGTSTLNTAILKTDTKNNWWTDWPTLVPVSEKPGHIGGASSLLFFEDFSNGLPACTVDDPNAKTNNGKLFWNTGNFLNTTFNWQLPMENIIIEFDGYCENNGINVFLQNENKLGYTLIIGGWNNTQSGSDVGSEVENRELVSGKVYVPKQWHHYKIERCGDLLSASCDDHFIFNRIVTRRFSGNGTLRFNSYSTRVGIDNISVKKCNENTQAGQSLSGQWNATQSNGYNGVLDFEAGANGTFTGEAVWNGFLTGTIKGNTSGNNVEFTINYPVGDIGYYKGTLNKNNTEITNGKVKGNNGVSATWVATKANAFSVFEGEWKINQDNGYTGTMTIRNGSSGNFQGTAIWNGSLSGIVEGKISGTRVEFTITYAGGVKGVYSGVINRDKNRINNGTVTGSNGVSAKWNASR